MNPASSSCASVPVSKRAPSGSDGAGRTLYGRHESSSSAACEGEPEVRAEELVRRADEHVDAEIGDVDPSVRRVVDRVRPRERARVVRELGDAACVGARADRVRGERERDDARPVRQLPLEVREIERRVVVQLDEADLEVEVVRELEPRRDVAVVVELRDEDLVARLQGSPDRPAEHEVERRHVRAEDRLVRSASEERRRCVARMGDEGIAVAAPGERASEVRVRRAEVSGDRVDHRVGALRAARRVEVRGRRRRARRSGPGPRRRRVRRCSSPGRYRTTMAR